jgi:hypothetical protein
MSKGIVATILGAIGMVCGTVVSCFYISRKDNMKMVEKVYEPINRSVDLFEMYIKHEMDEDDKINME